MRHLACIAMLAACGASTATPPTDPSVSNTAAVAAPKRSDSLLDLREIVDHEGSKSMVWLQPDHASGIDTNDACCGLSYDGNKYDDKLATCAIKDDECGPGKTGVYPGLADDPVCGERRRCVPLPAARVIAEDATPVTAVDAEQTPLPIGGANVAHGPVEPGREGFVVVRVAGKTQLVAVDYGSRYTIVVRGGAIDRVTRE